MVSGNRRNRSIFVKRSDCLIGLDFSLLLLFALTDYYDRVNVGVRRIVAASETIQDEMWPFAQGKGPPGCQSVTRPLFGGTLRM